MSETKIWLILLTLEKYLKKHQVIWKKKLLSLLLLLLILLHRNLFPGSLNLRGDMYYANYIALLELSLCVEAPKS